MRRWLLCVALWCHGVLLHATVVQAATPPQRIVSLLPSLTEMVCELGRCGSLVGVDRYSTYPNELQKLPQLGGGLDPNIEAIVALKPDLVLMSASSRASDRLTALGLRVVALETHDYADVKRVLGILGGILGVPDALRVWNKAQTGVNDIAKGMPTALGRMRVYFEVNQGPYAAGESSFIGETLKRLGVQNIVPARLGPFPKLNPEFVVRANPDVIMISQRNATDLFARPGWNGIRAIRENRVCIFSAEQTDVLVRPGPRITQAARIMADCLLAKGLHTP